LSTRLVDDPSGSQNVAPHHGFVDDGQGRDQGRDSQLGQLGQLDQGSGGAGGTNGSTGSNGSSGFGQLAPLFGGSGQPQARSGGS
jgi:hypothetical protein